MEALEKAIAMISAASGADASSVAERLNTDATPDALASELFEPKYKAQRDQGHNTGVDKTFRKIAQALKAAGAEEVTLDSLGDAVATVQSKAAAANPAALSEEQALKLPAVVKELNKLRSGTEAAVEAARTEERNKLANDRKEFDQKRTSEATRAEVKAYLKTLNPNYTAGKEAAQEARLVDEIMREGRFQLDDNGKPQLTDEEGNLLPGKLGNGIAQLSDFVREKAEDVYGLPVSTHRESPGLTPEQVAANAAKVAYAGPKTQDEYDTALLRAAPGAERQKLTADFKSYQTEQATA